jgi:Kef-type K+ transport system membrane component KefB
MTEPLHQASILPLLLVVGIAVFAGDLLAALFRRFRIPQVVGFISLGVVIGNSGLSLVDASHFQALQPFNFFALGLIGFMIGGELHRDMFRRHGMDFFKILVSESLFAFVCVTASVSAITWFTTHNAAISISLGLLLGSIASATAPAATVDVLWEYKTRGLLTSTVLAIVALDDGLALVLYSIASSVASMLTGDGAGGWWANLLHTGYELAGSIALGCAGAYVLNRLIQRRPKESKNTTLALGMVTLVLGCALWAELDAILTAMSLGACLSNITPGKARSTFDSVERFTPPVYALFFVLVGARLSVHGMPLWLWGIVAAYVLGRTFGKMSGAYAGGRWARIPKTIRNNLGFCLFSQAGVAIGLSLLAGIRFSDVMIGDISLGMAIPLVITTTTFFVQLVGPPCVKLAAQKAGEIGLSSSAEDLLAWYKASDAMEPTPPFGIQTRVKDILQTVAQSDSSSFCIVSEDNNVLGMVALEQLKRCFADADMNEWLLAVDIMDENSHTVSAAMSLAEVVEEMQKWDIDAVAVVTADTKKTYCGTLEMHSIHRKINRELQRRRQLAETR